MLPSVKNGMKMIFQNVLYADTDGEKGMANTSRLIYDTIDLYNKRHDYFIAILNNFWCYIQITYRYYIMIIRTLVRIV